MSIIRGLIGLAVIFFIAFLFCKEKRNHTDKNIILMVVFQVVLTFLLLNTSVGLTILTAISNFFTWLTAQGMSGCNFVFGGIEVSKGSSVFFFKKPLTQRKTVRIDSPLIKMSHVLILS